MSRFFVAVTGAQGVGKSTFCRSLRETLREVRGGDVPLLDNLRARLGGVNVPLGSASNAQTIFAVWTTHLEREAEVSADLVLLDRCVVDALAYTRVLRLGSDVEQAFFERVGLLASRTLGFVVHLRLSPFFKEKGAPHETEAHRFAVAREIENVLAEFDLPAIHVDADAPCSIKVAAKAVLSAMNDGSCG